MKKTILTMMAAAMIATTGTALAATPRAVDFGDNTTRIETNYAHCGGGSHHGGRGGRGGHGCGDGYCWGNENNNEG